jgi:uncharacterized lipoprotein YajG
LFTTGIFSSKTFVVTTAKMKIAFMLLSLFIIAACTASRKMKSLHFKPDDVALYNAIVQQDSIYFDACNKRNMAQ